MTDAPVDLDELERLKRKVRGVKAPCRQCGDTLAKCMSQPGLCCVGCNHASAAPATPPADEVAGLRAVRDASAEVLLAWHGNHAGTRLDVELSELQKAFDASLKGER